MIGFKSVNAQALSWHDGTFGPWAVGAELAVKNAEQGEPCGTGLHIAKTVSAAVGYGRFPLRLFSVEGVGPVLGEDDTKARFGAVRVLEEIAKPSWVLETEAFIESIATVPWFKPQRKPRKAWKHHKSRAAARAAAWAAARAAAWDAARAAARAAAWAAAWDAARAAAGDAARAAAGAAAGDAARAAAWAAVGDAALQARMTITSDLKFPNAAKHRKHVAARWDVWTSGYGLVCDVDGRLFTYEMEQP